MNVFKISESGKGKIKTARNEKPTKAERQKLKALRRFKKRNK